MPGIAFHYAYACSPEWPGIRINSPNQAIFMEFERKFFTKLTPPHIELIQSFFLSNILKCRYAAAEMQLSEFAENRETAPSLTKKFISSLTNVRAISDVKHAGSWRSVALRSHLDSTGS